MHVKHQLSRLFGSIRQKAKDGKAAFSDTLDKRRRSLSFRKKNATSLNNNKTVSRWELLGNQEDDIIRNMEEDGRQVCPGRGQGKSDDLLNDHFQVTVTVQVCQAQTPMSNEITNPVPESDDGDYDNFGRYAWSAKSGGEISTTLVSSSTMPSSCRQQPQCTQLENRVPESGSRSPHFGTQQKTWTEEIGSGPVFGLSSPGRDDARMGAIISDPGVSGGAVEDGSNVRRRILPREEEMEAVKSMRSVQEVVEMHKSFGETFAHSSLVGIMRVHLPENQHNLRSDPESSTTQKVFQNVRRRLSIKATTKALKKSGREVKSALRHGLDVVGRTILHSSSNVMPQSFEFPPPPSSSSFNYADEQMEYDFDSRRNTSNFSSSSYRHHRHY